MQQPIFTATEFDSNGRYIGEYEIPKPDWDKQLAFKSRYRNGYMIQIDRYMNGKTTVLEHLFS